MVIETALALISMGLFSAVLVVAMLMLTEY
jgi:hypothetical protein